jgi:hypothetical protein
VGRELEKGLSIREGSSCVVAKKRHVPDPEQPENDRDILLERSIDEMLIY